MSKKTSSVLLLGASLLLLAASYQAVAADPLRVVIDEANVSLCEDQSVLLRYIYRDVPFKPYVQQLYSPGRVNVLLDAPADHLHHHALMFAVTVDGVNFWEEQQAPGRQVHRRFSDTRVDSRNSVPIVGFSEQLQWMNPRSEEVLLKEDRTIELCRLAEPEVTLLTWQSKLEPPTGKKELTLTGSHYHGLGMRFLRSMDAGGQFRNADGKPGVVFRGDERLVRSHWCAYTARADGKLVTVAMFDHPDNPRHPATWFTMTKPFAYLSATLALHKQPLAVSAGRPLLLKYGVVLWDDQVVSERIEEFYNRWVDWSR